MTTIQGPPDIGTALSLIVAPLALVGAGILSEAMMGALLVWLLRHSSVKIQ